MKSQIQKLAFNHLIGTSSKEIDANKQRLLSMVSQTQTLDTTQLEGQEVGLHITELKLCMFQM